MKVQEMHVIVEGGENFFFFLNAELRKMVMQMKESSS